MVQKPATIPALLALRDAAKQAVALENALSALKAKHVLGRIHSQVLDVPEGYAGFAVVPKLENFGIFQVPASNEAWAKASGWTIHTRIAGVKSSRAFDTEDFVVMPETLDAFKRLDAEQSVVVDRFDENLLRVFPVRMTRDPNPELSEGEFFLDLASLMWLFISHPKWILGEGELLLRCLGQRGLNGEAFVLGYRNRARTLFHAPAHTQEGIVIIGKVP